MPPQHTSPKGPALLLALAAAAAGFIPAAMAWDTLRRWLTPVRHAEEVMGRGLEAIFIGGPVGACLCAAVAWRLALRTGRHMTLSRSAMFAILALGLAIAAAKSVSLI
jgi:hypothetical protein